MTEFDALPAVVGALAALAAALWPTRRAARRSVARGILRPGGSAGLRSRTAVQTPRGRVKTDIARRWRRLVRRHGAQTDELVGLIDALAPALEAGLGADRAWELALSATGTSGDGSAAALTRAVTAAVAAGAPVGPEITAQARAARSAPLLLLGTAWHLSERTGAPLATTSRTVARMLRADQDATARLDAVATESATTARILTALPLSAPLVVAALGLDPRALATGGPWVTCAIATGVVLALIGRTWLRRLADRVLRGPTIS